MNNIYQDNLEKYREQVLEVTKKLKDISLARISLFAYSFLLVIVLANVGLAIAVGIIIPLCGLGLIHFIRKSNEITYQKEHLDFLEKINEQEVLRIENKLSTFPSGKSHIRLDHPYVADLDIFGSHSLFQLINRTTTESGENCLASWLSQSASTDVIINRQKAIQELSPNLEWRQDFQASGMHYSNTKSDYRKLLEWLEKPEQLLPHEKQYIYVSIFLGILSTVTLIFHFIYAYTSGYILHTLPLVFVLIINSLFLRRIKPIAEEIITDTHKNTKILGGYESLILKIDSKKFNSKILQQLQSIFKLQGYSAANEIKKLRKILELSQLKGIKGIGGNQFYPLFNSFWIVDTYWIIQTERWKKKNRSHLQLWADAVSEFETLCSIAGFAYSNPTYTYPEFKKEPFTIHFEMLGHPLISPKDRVSNDFDLEGHGKITMITGSNMAGKSTFLRTVGANMVLALMGAPCCAKTGKVSNVGIFSSMRTQDNLEEGVSSFYAELKRIEQLLTLVNSGKPTFFLLDEMFKGTNSKDRYKGGFSLIKQLREMNAFGIISTHDLELAILAGKHMLVDNFSFNSEIKESELFFDYKYTDGLCKDFNASELMKRSGINIINDFEEIG